MQPILDFSFLALLAAMTEEAEKKEAEQENADESEEGE